MKKIVPPNAVLIPKHAKNVFKGVIFDVYHWSQKLFDDSETTFEALRRPDTVTVIGVADDKILVLDDDQPHVGSRISFPGGRVDSDETGTLQAAKREMLEETGYEFMGWRLLRVWQPHTKIEWFIYLYLAWDGSQTAQPHPDAGERITVRKLSFSEAKNLTVTKSGYLGESKEIFETLNNLEDLLNLPEFNGKEIDR